MRSNTAVKYSVVDSDPDPQVSALILVGLIRILEGKNYPKNRRM
jgi:hypothetical protein